MSDEGRYLQKSLNYCQKVKQITDLQGTFKTQRSLYQHYVRLQKHDAYDLKTRYFVN